MAILGNTAAKENVCTCAMLISGYLMVVIMSVKSVFSKTISIEIT